MLPHLCFKIGFPCLVFVLSFQKHIYSIQRWDSNPRPLEHESPPITTGQGSCTNPIYVIMTNVKDQHNILLQRPFDHPNNIQFQILVPKLHNQITLQLKEMMDRVSPIVKQIWSIFSSIKTVSIYERNIEVPHGTILLFISFYQVKSFMLQPTLRYVK